MAKATQVRQEDSIERVVTQIVSFKRTPQPVRITLDLSLEEAQTLFTLTGNVAGKVSGRRQYTQAVYYALEAAGVPYISSARMGLTGSMDFPDTIRPEVSPVKETQASQMKVTDCASSSGYPNLGCPVPSWDLR